MRHGVALSTVCGLLVGLDLFYLFGTAWRMARFPQTLEDKKKDLVILLWLAAQLLVVACLW